MATDAQGIHGATRDPELSVLIHPDAEPQRRPPRLRHRRFALGTGEAVEAVPAEVDQVVGGQVHSGQLLRCPLLLLTSAGDDHGDVRLRQTCPSPCHNGSSMPASVLQVFQDNQKLLIPLDHLQVDVTHGEIEPKLQ